MVTWPESLVLEISDRRVIIFVGSGVSKAAHNIMPTWSQLLIELSAKLPKAADQALVKRLCGQFRLLDAAQIISDGINKADFNAAMKAKFQVRPSPHHELYQSLLALDAKTIVTTNYDEFIEKNFDHFSGGIAAYNVCQYTSRDFLDQVRSPQRTIAKMHGCITDTSSLVLDRMSYFNARQSNNGFFSLLSALFATHTVLFLGYSLGDPDMQIILETNHSLMSGEHGHYALMPKLDHRSMTSAIKRSYNITCIEYPSGQHDLVPKSLGELALLVGETRKALGIRQ